MKQTKNKTTTKAKSPAPRNKTGREVVPAKSKALSKPIDFARDARAGQEGMSQQDYMIPRLNILQDGSPQCKKGDERYIRGAEAGDICDTVTGTLFPGAEGIAIIPISYRRAHIEWVTRKKGGGFIADHGTDSSVVDKCERTDDGVLLLPNGHEIKVIGEYFTFLVDTKTGQTTPYVLSMTGSQWKKARRWNTMMNQFMVAPEGNGEPFNPAMFYRVYQFTTTPERNDKGSWFGWVIEPLTNTVELPNGETIYLKARSFREGIASGKVQASAPTQESVHTEVSTGGHPDDDDTPM